MIIVLWLNLCLCIGLLAGTLMLVWIELVNVKLLTSWILWLVHAIIFFSMNLTPMKEIMMNFIPFDMWLLWLWFHFGLATLTCMAVYLYTRIDVIKRKVYKPLGVKIQLEENT